jgi:hypothetical protein
MPARKLIWFNGAVAAAFFALLGGMFLTTQEERVHDKSATRGGHNKGFKNKAGEGRSDKSENRGGGNQAHKQESEDSRKRGFTKSWKKRKNEKSCMGGYRKVVGTECEISVRKRRSRPKLSIRKTFYADVRRLSEKKSFLTERFQPSYRPSHALSYLKKDIFSLLTHCRQMEATIVRKHMKKQRSVIGKICDAIKNKVSRISVAELRALSVQHGPSKKCTHTSININVCDAVLFFDTVSRLSHISHSAKLFFAHLDH